MVSPPASTASADLLASSVPTQPTLHADSLAARGGFGHPQENLQHVINIPSEILELGVRNHGRKPFGPEGESVLQGPPAELHQKRKREDDSTLDAQACQNLSKTGPQQPDKFITELVSTSTSRQTKIPSTAGFNEKRFKMDKPLLGPATEIKNPSKPIILPAELWQHIFCFVPPISLGRLVRVNRAFHEYLDGNYNSEDLPALSNSIAQPMKAEAIWFASRKHFCPGLPRPLQDMSELAMWRLLRGSNCQICGRIFASSASPSPDTPWENGPGQRDTRIIWPFGVRTCGPCLKDITETEMDLLLSSDCPSILLQGLPFAFISEEEHFITHTTMRNSKSLPPTPKLVKQYYKPHIETIKRQLNDAKELGGASTEEWIKGLAHQGQQRITSTFQWEQWEAKGGLKKINARPQPKRPSSGTATAEEVFPTPAMKTGHPTNMTLPHTLALQTNLGRNHTNPIPPKPQESSLMGLNAPRPYQPAWTGFNMFPGQSPFGRPIHQSHQSKPERNIHDVNEAKAARRADIEHRCASLDHPIPPNVLNHMDSFQAALQISQPMTDSAWLVLKPRLLAQLPYAERREEERVQEANILVEESKLRRQQEAQLQETMDGLDRDWETLQGPIRIQLGALADDTIDIRWSKGKSITKETAPKFAADVLVQVRQRFYAGMAKEDEASPATGGGSVKTDRFNGPPLPILNLENMKWVFDNKIKPLTDHFQRELFLCNDCDSNFKFYGFEGVIQHFAAKHTIDLSMGNIVVHWRAQWPEHPPFDPNPSPSKTAYYKVPTPTPTSCYNVSPVGMAGTAVSVDLPSNVDVAKEAAMLPKTLPAPVCPLVTVAQRQNTSAYQMGIHAVEANILANPARNPITQQQWETSSICNALVPGFYASSNAVPAQHLSSTQGFPQHPIGAAVSNPLVVHPATQTYGTMAALPGRTMLGLHSDFYKRQMDEMARHAKEVFSGLGGVKDIPGNVRIFVTIQHTVSRFKATFDNEPTLQMFIDGLDHNATMRPVRSINGLACKSCIMLGAATGVGLPNHGKIVGDRRLYTLPHLVNHFKNVHLDPSKTSETPQTNFPAPHDWKNDMIELPDESFISSLATAPGMTGSKLILVSTVFPDAFSYPRSSLNGPTETSGYPSNGANEFAKYGSWPQVAPSEAPGDDEYDPSRPAILHRLAKVGDPSDLPIRHAGNFDIQHGKPSSLQKHHEDHGPMGYVGLLNEETAGSSRSREDFSNGYYSSHQNVHLRGRASSPQTNTNAGERYEQLSTIENSRQRLLNEMENFSDISKNSTSASDYTRSGNVLTSSKHGQAAVQVIEPDDAADRFLSFLETGPRRLPHANRVDQGGAIPRRPHNIGEERSGDDWRQGKSKRIREADIAGSPMRRPTVIPDDGHDIHGPPRPYHQEEYHPRSHMPKQLKADSLGEGETFTHARTSRNGVQRSQGAPPTQSRGRSRSPADLAPESTLYRTRSPVEEDRGDSVYQVRAAHAHRSQGAERIVSYEYPSHDQYEYVDERNIQPQYGTRVEYLPFSMGTTPARELPRKLTRYVIAQPKSPARPEHIRYESGFEREPLYEIDGQLIAASQVHFAEPSGRASVPYPQEYRY